MNESLLFLAAPFAMCLLLVGIHCYLGLHVLARGVVFVDLSLAQIASLGACASLLFAPKVIQELAPGLASEIDTKTQYFFSLAATLIASAFFAYVKRLNRVVSQEAIIGIAYAFSTGAVILVLDGLPHGTEHLKEALIGQILWVGWPEVFWTLVIYLFVGILHWIFKAQFFQSSFNDQPTPWIWDFLFYALFGVVISSSTSVAGVLVVFSSLIVPAVLGCLFFTSFRSRLMFGWAIGSVVSLIGMGLSFKLDLPVGATLVVLLTALPLAILPLYAFSQKLIIGGKTR